MIWKTTLSFLANLLDPRKVSMDTSSGLKAVFTFFIGALISFSPGKTFAQCDSQNVTVTDFFFADANQNPIDPNGGYNIGDPVSGFIYASFGGSSGNGYSLYLEYDVYINDVFQEKVSTCLFEGQQIPQGSIEQISSFTWNWGDKLELKNYYMDWETNNKKRVCTKLSRNAQCYGAPFSILVRTPLVANFDFTTSCEDFFVDFENLTTGGDTENYLFTWNFAGLGNSNEINPAFDFKGAGIYNVTLTVQDGISTSSLTKTINLNELLSVNYVSTDLGCGEVNTGEIDLSLQGGSQSYSIQWSGPNDFSATTQDLIGLAPGTYSAEISDTAGCTVTIEVVIVQPETPAAPVVAEVSQPTCDVATGSFSITAEAGMDYSFNGGTFSENIIFEDLSAGTYTVVARNADECVSEALSVTIEEQPETPAAPVVAEISQPTCDIATGSFSITAVDGMEYSFNGGAFETTTSWSELAAGTYIVVARNADGCVSEELSVTIEEQPETPAAPAVAEISQPTCDVATGSFSITAEAGMTYSFNGGAFGTTTSWNELAAGTYTVVARNADGCVSEELSVTINAQPDTPAAPVVAEVAQPTCDVATGSFSITAVAGMEYSFDGGAFGTTTSWSELAAGTYTVVARNADGCISEALSVTINEQPETPAAPLVAETVQPTCEVATGSFSITAVSGIEYSFNGGAFGSATSWDQLSAGTYTVVARNAAECISEALSVTINEQPQTPAAPVVAQVSQPTCEVATGSFSITAVSGMEYSFDGGAFASTTSWSELVAGTYTVTARNEDGCVSDELSVTIEEQPETPAAPVVAETVQPTCEVATGSFSITAEAGMEYSFDGGTFSENVTFDNLATGTYTVVARNQDGCVSDELTVTINAQPETPAAPAVAETVQPTCEVATGSFSITAVSGMEYSFDGGAFASTTSWSELVAGTYTVTARNEDGCISDELTVTINEQPETSAAPVVAETVQPTCDVAIGSFSITAVSGMEYAFNGGTFSENAIFDNLAAGTYTVTARNEDGCVSEELTVTINAQPETPAAPVVAQVSQPTCEVATGSFSITAVAGMEYSFNGGAFESTTSWSELAAGTYTVVARNNDGCISEALSVTINDQPETPAAPVVAETVQPNCEVATGSFSITAVSGMEYSFDGGAFGSSTSWSELAAGTYTVVARNAEECVSEALSVTINAQPETPAAPVVAETVQPTCDVATGSFSITAVDAMEYSFNGGAFGTTTSWSDLAAGTYTIVGRNADGCVSGTLSVTINEQLETPAAPVVAEVSQPTCDVATGSLSITAVAGMEYSFNGGTFSENVIFDNLSAGTYTVVARNAYGCISEELSVTINDQPKTPAAPLVAETVQPTCGIATGSFSITAVDGMEYSFDGSTFGTSTSWSELAAGTYTVVARNEDGCMSEAVSVTINDQPETPAAPVVAEVNQPTCEVATGSFSITAVAGMEYSFNGGAFGTSTSWNELGAGTYNVVARNADGCVSEELSVTINAQPETPAAPVVAETVQPTCEVATGSFGITAEAGMEYSFNGGTFGTTTSWSELAAGIYTVVARNADGCVSEALSVTINAQPETPAAPVVAETVQPTCEVATGSFSITAVDGMQYSFNGGAFGTTTSWSELAAGTYTIVARNEDGCGSEAVSVIINDQPETPAAPEVAEVTHPTCEIATGSFSINAVNGMQYSFNGGAFETTTSWSELAAGTYTVVARNEDGCMSEAVSVTINDQPETPAAPVVAEVSQPTCEVAFGSFSITAEAGMEYSFNGGTFSENVTFDNLAAGTYTVVARNADECVSEALSVTINEQPETPVAPVVAEVSHPTCEVATGSFSITAESGMEYSFDGGTFGTTTSWSELAAGIYTVVARNADECVSEELSVTINAQPETPAAPVVAETVQPTCELATGSFSITAVDGMEYSFNGGVFESATFWSELAAGTYFVVARNEDGCVSETVSVIINDQPETPAAPVVTEVNQPTCDVATGSFSITAVDGMEYSFNGGVFESATFWSKLAAGTYSVVARNADECVSEALSVTINEQPDTPAAPVVAEVSQPTCEVATGSFSITAEAGMEYSFDGGTFGTTTSWSELAAGTYTVVTRNADECTSEELSVTINAQPETPAAPVIAETVQPTCDVATGSFSINAFDGMEYSFNGGAFGTSTSWNELGAGTYNVVARNADGCISEELSVTIEEQPETPATPVVAEVAQPTCDVATGSFSITAVAGMEYSFDGGAFGTTTSWSELAAGTYAVVARNADGCISEALSVTINEQPETPAAPVVAEISQPTCDVATGSFSITAVDGMQYSFNGGAFGTSTSWNELGAGTYTVVARNADECVSEELSVTINAQPETPAAPVIAETVQPTCDIAAGYLSVTAVAGLEYSFNGGTFSENVTFDNLAAGTYTVVARNTDGCVSEALSLTINEQPETPAAPVVAETVQPTCEVATGSFSITAVDGMQYSFNGGAFGTTTSWSELASGTYTVVARNADGCVSEALSVTISSAPEGPATPVIEELMQPTCEDPSGFLVLALVDDVTFSLTDAEGNEFADEDADGIFDSLVPGNYTVTAKNENGCVSDAATLTIEEPQGDLIVTSPSEAICDDSGSFDLNNLVSGGSDTGTWIDTDLSGALSGSSLNTDIAAGFYTFTYVIEGGCPSSTEITIEIEDCGLVLPCEIEDISNSISKAVTPNGDNINDNFEVGKGIDCGFIYTLKVFNRWGNEVFSSNNYTNNWDGTSINSVSGDQLPSGTYFYIVEIQQSGFNPIQGYIYLGTK
ncbi:gliding motility-associated C-terminal domain-containing protein [Salinimicrobium terrae]|uniref:T9SS type B sorting domain-containing protein n=1 Tax=Salinimicrobium terrae TaxID=470866 RepID=UPI0012EBD91D|nr:gliding motility-associated C-terminal domain-containing protein [Salinimicrobium terrae]